MVDARISRRTCCGCACRCASSCHSLTMTLDGNLIASGHFDGALRFWDVRSGREARTVKGLHEQQICSVAVGHLGGELLVSTK